MASISNVALLKRLRSAAGWLGYLLSEKLAETASFSIVVGRGYNIRLVDATTIRGPGDTSSYFRLHLGFNLKRRVIDHLEVTSQRGGETLKRFSFAPGDLVVGDAGYSRSPGLYSVIKAGADFLVRHSWQSLPLTQLDGQPLNLLQLVRDLPDAEAGSFPVLVRRSRDKRTPAFPARLVVLRKSEQATGQARATFVRMRATMATQAKGHKKKQGITELLEPERSAVLSVMNESIKSYESRIKKLIKADAKMDRAAVILDSMPGICEVNISHFCIHLKVIMDCTAKELTALTGFSPKHNQSGKSLHGRSKIDKQGWGERRKSLYMAANCAATYCPRFREFKERLVAKGKPPRLAVVAVARKMLVIAHSLLRKDQLFDPNYKIT